MEEFGKQIRQTEDMMTTITTGSEEFYSLAVCGVGYSHELVINMSRGKPLYLAFNNDYQKNPAVLRQFNRLLNLRLNSGGEQTRQTVTKILN